MLDIRHLVYRFIAEEPLDLNRDVPSVSLRGAFGYGLRDLLANDATLSRDTDRIVIFRDLFAPALAERASRKSGNTPPPPFVIRGAFTSENLDTFVMEILLLGDAHDMETLVDMTAVVMARRGLGGDVDSGTPCQVEKLDSLTEYPAFSPEIERLVVEFISPARLRAMKRWWHEEVPFPVLVARLAGRFQDLVTTYGQDDNRDWAQYRRDLTEMAKDVLHCKLEGTHAEGRRVSTRTGDECALDGFVGRMLYQGNFQPFSEILGYLPFIHVGKSAAFGCGWCNLVTGDIQPLYA